MNDLMAKVVSLCKRRGFIFQSSEIYGGLANTYDYAPLGVELKNNVKQAWWRSSVYRRDDIYGMDASILMHPKVWEASGHLGGFFDLRSDCKKCKKHFKVADLKEKNVCPECLGPLTQARPFNLMFKTHIGPVEESASIVYLRPETAQGMFVNFINILDTRHPKLPFGLAQIGKAFRNEITPGNFTFRTREFEQMEIEYFVKPDEANKYYDYWVEERFNWYTKLGIRKENLRKRSHKKDELAHYAKACTDIEYHFPFSAGGVRLPVGQGSASGGSWQELEGIANRADFDLRKHSEFSGKDLQFYDDQKKNRFYPYIIEPSGGVDRAVLAFLVDAYQEEKVKAERRVFLRLDVKLAPVKVAILPLLRNRAQIVELAKRITKDLKSNFLVSYDDTGSIGKLYRRQDEIGTPFCVTVDVESLSDKKATVRERDSMQQERISLDRLSGYLSERLQ